MKKLLTLLLVVGVLMLGTISAVAGDSEDSHSEDLMYLLFPNEIGDDPIPCGGGGSDGGGGAPG
jgi:hypothetical protein